jgi:hypothetical protein
MNDRRRDQGLRRGLAIAIVLVMLGWLGLILILSRRDALSRRQPEAVLPIYPSALELRENSVPDRDWKTAVYYVALDYPSLDVFNHCDDRMTQQGWSREGAPDLPQWRVARDDHHRHATLVAAWLSPDHLLQLDLCLEWKEPERAPRGAENEKRMRVTATMQRTAAPFLKRPPKRPAPADKAESPFAH